MSFNKNTFILFFILFSIILPFHHINANESKVAELEAKIEDVNAEIARLDKEIAKYELEIAKTGNEAKTLTNHIKELNLTRSKLLKQVEQINSQIKLVNENINVISKDINTKEDQIKLAEDAMSKTFYDLYRSDNINIIETILMNGGLKSLSNEYNNKILISEKLNSFINNLNQIRISLKENKEKEESEKKRLSQLNTQLALEKKVIDQNKAEKDRLLKETKNQEAAYQKLLAENKKKIDAFAKDLRDYEAQLQFILNNDLLPNKENGILDWPLKKFIITQFFGKTASSGRLYASGSHSGVDFGVPTGTPIYSVADGTVEGVGDTDRQCKGVSFGKWVFIRHNNGLASTYGHLSATSVSVGQKISKGDLIALSGNTGHSTGPHLHLTIYASQGAEVKSVPTKSAYCKGVSLVMPIAPTSAYLDPMVYLPIPSSSMVKKGI